MHFTYKEKIELLLEKFKYSTKLAEVLNVSRRTILNWREGGSISEENRLKIDTLFAKYVILKNLEKERIEEEIKKIVQKDYSSLITSIDIIEEVSKINAFGSLEIEISGITQNEFYNIVEGSYVEKDIEKRKLLEANNLAFLTKRVIFHTVEGKLKKIDTRTIKEWYLSLFTGIREDAGEYTTKKRIIKDSDLHLTLPEDISEEMEYWVKLYGNCSNIYDIAKAHEHFELIHPFGDGNGRIGRLIIVHQTVKLGLLPPLINKHNKALYYATLEKAQKSGEILPLTWFLAKGIEAMERRLK